MKNENILEDLSQIKQEQQPLHVSRPLTNRTSYNIIKTNVKPLIEKSRYWFSGFQRAADGGNAVASTVLNGFKRVKRKAFCAE